MAKEYPNSELLERAYVVWMFHKPELRDKYLPRTLPSIFFDVNRRLIIYCMQKLTERSMEINVPNLVMYMQTDSETLMSFMKKHKARRLTEDEVNDIIKKLDHINEILIERYKKLSISYIFEYL